MSEKKKSKKKGQEIPVKNEVIPTKLEYAVATYLKNNVVTKKTKFLSHPVDYFSASKAIDVLMDSKWATGKDVIFTDRESIVAFCDKLLQLKFFHRAKKIPITDKDLKPKELKKKKEKEKEEKKRKVIEGKEDKPKKEEEKSQEEDGEDSAMPEDKDAPKEKKRKKAKIKLDMHLEQVFIDGSDAYVWIYDPTPFWYYIVGALCLLGAIAICLFPLWPPSVRKGVYYLSMAAAGFLGVILALAVLRLIIFVVLWCLSMGRHHFWILPNLTEDVGFFASFWPLYHYEYRGNDYHKKKSKKKKKDENEDQDPDMNALPVSDKRSDNEEVQGNTSAGEGEAEADMEVEAEGEKVETDAEKTGGENTAHSETDSEQSNSQTFEVVNKEDLLDDANEYDKKEN